MCCRHGIQGGVMTSVHKAERNENAVRKQLGCVVDIASSRQWFRDINNTNEPMKKKKKNERDKPPAV